MFPSNRARSDRTWNGRRRSADSSSETQCARARGDAAREWASESEASSHRDIARARRGLGCERYLHGERPSEESNSASPPRTRARTKARASGGVERARATARTTESRCASDDDDGGVRERMMEIDREFHGENFPDEAIDRVSALPRDVIVEIVRGLGRERDVAACALTCSIFRSATQSESVWRNLLAAKLGLEADVLLPKRLKDERRTEEGEKLDAGEIPRWMAKYKSWHRPQPGTLTWSSTTRDYGLEPAESKYAARYLHRCTAVGDRSKILFFGGQGGGSDFYNDLHLLDLNQRDGLQLKQLHVGSSNEPPFPRCSGTLTAMAIGGVPDSEVVALFGGSQGFFEGFSNSLRILCADDGSRVGETATVGAGLTWHEPVVRAHPSNPAGRIPDARWGHSAVAFDGKLLLFGGSNTTHCFADTWLLELTQEQGKLIATWTLLSDGNGKGCPPPRAGQTASLVGSALFIFGGCHISEVFNDVWKLDVVGVPKEKLRWEEFKVVGTPPSPRVGHAAVVLGDRIILCGGRGSSMKGTVGKYATGDEGLASMQGLTFFQSGFCMLDTTARKWLPVQHPVIEPSDGEKNSCDRITHVREHRTGHVMMPARNGCLLLIGGLGYNGNFQNDLSLVSLF